MADEKPEPEEERPEAARPFNLDEVLPVNRTAVWKGGPSIRREDIYDYRI